MNSETRDWLNNLISSSYTPFEWNKTIAHILLQLTEEASRTADALEEQTGIMLQHWKKS